MSIERAQSYLQIMPKAFVKFKKYLYKTVGGVVHKWWGTPCLKGVEQAPHTTDNAPRRAEYYVLHV